jgi:hypothetical protein
MSKAEDGASGSSLFPVDACAMLLKTVYTISRNAVDLRFVALPDSMVVYVPFFPYSSLMQVLCKSYASIISFRFPSQLLFNIQFFIKRLIFCDVSESRCSSFRTRKQLVLKHKRRVQRVSAGISLERGDYENTIFDSGSRQYTRFCGSLFILFG